MWLYDNGRCCPKASWDAGTITWAIPAARFTAPPNEMQTRERPALAQKAAQALAAKASAPDPLSTPEAKAQAVQMLGNASGYQARRPVPSAKLLLRRACSARWGPYVSTFGARELTAVALDARSQADSGPTADDSALATKCAALAELVTLCG